MEKCFVLFESYYIGGLCDWHSDPEVKGVTMSEQTAKDWEQSSSYGLAQQKRTYQETGIITRLNQCPICRLGLVPLNGSLPSIQQCPCCRRFFAAEFNETVMALGYRSKWDGQVIPAVQSDRDGAIHLKIKDLTVWTIDSLTPNIINGNGDGSILEIENALETLYHRGDFPDCIDCGRNLYLFSSAITMHVKSNPECKAEAYWKPLTISA